MFLTSFRLNGGRVKLVAVKQFENRADKSQSEERSCTQNRPTQTFPISPDKHSKAFRNKGRLFLSKKQMSPAAPNISISNISHWLKKKRTSINFWINYSRSSCTLWHSHISFYSKEQVIKKNVWKVKIKKQRRWISSEFQHSGRLTLQVSGGLKDSDMAQKENKETHVRIQSQSVSVLGGAQQAQESNWVYLLKYCASKYKTEPKYEF